MPMSDRVSNVILHLETQGLGKRPLVFVTHSMGGLLVKQLLRTANEKSTKEPWKAVLKNTRGVCFIATPHIGSDLANQWASYFGILLKTNVSTKELIPHGTLLRELNTFYRDLVIKRGVNIKTVSFFETRPFFGDTLVVAEGDADPNVDQAGPYSLGEDHFSICKPLSPLTPIHLKIVDFIRDCFQLTPPLPGQTHSLSLSPGKPPWRPGLIAVPTVWPPRLVGSVVGAAVVLCVIAYLIPGTWGTHTGIPPRATAPPPRSEQGLELVSLDVIDTYSFPILDFKFRNIGPYVSYIKKVELIVLEKTITPWAVQFSAGPATFQYNLLLKPRTDATVYQLSVSQPVPSNDTDRFQVIVGQASAYNDIEYVDYKFSIKVHYDRDGLVDAGTLSLRISSAPYFRMPAEQIGTSLEHRLDALKSKNPLTVAEIARVLGALKEVRAVDALTSVFSNDPNDYITFCKTQSLDKFLKHDHLISEALEDMYYSIFRSLNELTGSFNEHYINSLSVEYRGLAQRGLKRAQRVN